MNSHLCTFCFNQRELALSDDTNTSCFVPCPACQRAGAKPAPADLNRAMDAAVNALEKFKIQGLLGDQRRKIA